MAALWGHTDIVKILAPLAEYPNAQSKDGVTLIQFARNEEIRRILKSHQSSKMQGQSQTIIKVIKVLKEK